MSMKILPDSGVTCMVMGSDVFAFAQTYEGDVYQFAGEVDSSDSRFYRSRSKSKFAAERTVRGDPPVARAGSPRMFTPIAAVSFARYLNQPMTDRYVVYLDDNDVLNDAFATGDNAYQHGSLSTLNVKCAHYTSLAAVTIQGRFGNFIGVFYQDVGADGAVKMVSFNGPHNRWELGTANLRDPPLFGTSITAVAPRAGIQGQPNPSASEANAGQPIYYLQLDNNALGSGQGESEPLPVHMGYETSGKPMVFSPHTSLTAVDNGTDLRLVYKSHSGKIKMVRIDSNGVQGSPEQICGDVSVAPRSSIAACLAPGTSGSTSQIVFFYQGLEVNTRKVQFSARTATRDPKAGPNTGIPPPPTPGSQAAAQMWHLTTPERLAE